MGFTVMFTALLAQAAPVCAVDGQPVAVVLPMLKSTLGPALSGWWQGARAVAGDSELVIDERVTTYTVAVPHARTVAVPVALPDPWRGALLVTPQPGACLTVRVYRTDDELARISIDGPALAWRAARAGGPAIEKTLSGPLVWTGNRINVSDGNGIPLWLYGGRALPSERALYAGASTSGEGAAAEEVALAYTTTLAALDAQLSTDLTGSSSSGARTVAFMAAAGQLRKDAALWLPARRVAWGRALDVSSLPSSLRPLARFWQSEFAADTSTTPASAVLLVDDTSDEIWLDGVQVYARNRGDALRLSVPARAAASRIWVVYADRASNTSRVFDTRAALRAGDIYNVGGNVVAPVAAGARHECVRVTGTLPGNIPLRWRELGSPPGPILDASDAYRPSSAQDRREVAIVDYAGMAASLPPVPLVYNYTHAGVYNWTLSSSGALRLQVNSDAKDNKGCATAAVAVP